MSDRALDVLAQALPVDPDDGTMPIEYFAIDDRDGYGLVREWSVPETVAEKQLAALTDAGLVVIDTRDSALVEHLDDALVEYLCEVQHDAYEAAAAEHGWSTQQASRKPWADVPEANKQTMRTSMRAVLAALAKGDDHAD